MLFAFIPVETLSKNGNDKFADPDIDSTEFSGIIIFSGSNIRWSQITVFN